MWDDMYPLKFAARKFHTMLSNLCGIAVRKAEDFIMDSCCAAGSINLCENGKQKKEKGEKTPPHKGITRTLISGIKIRILEIHHQRVVEELRVLC